MLAHLALLTVTITMTAAWWGPSPAYKFLNEPATPEVVALGGCSTTRTDAEAGLYNPAALGVFHLENKCAVSFPLHGTPVLPLTDEAYTASQSVSAGLSLSQLGLAPEHGPNLSFAFGYARSEKHWGELPGSISGYGDDFIVEQVAESVESYSISVAIDYKVRLACGYSSKQAHSDFARISVNDDEARLYDIGLMFTTRLRRRLHRSDSPFSAEHTFVNVVPTISFVHRNAVRKLPPEAYYYNYPGERLIRARNVLGLSVRGALDREDRVELISFTAAAEFSGETNSRAEVESVGAEIGICGLLFLRTGNRTNAYYDYSTGGDLVPNELAHFRDARSFNSYGFGVDLGGALAWAWEMGWLPRPQKPLSDVFDNLNLSFDYARMNVDRYDIPDLSQSGIKLSLSF